MSSKRKDNFFLKSFKQGGGLVAETNFDFFTKGAHKEEGRNHKLNINMTTISVPNDRTKAKAKTKSTILNRNVLTTSLIETSEKSRLCDMKKWAGVENKRVVEHHSGKEMNQFSDGLLKRIDELSMKNSQSSTNNLAQSAFMTQARELITLINQPPGLSSSKKGNAVSKLQNKLNASRNASDNSPYAYRAFSSMNLKIDSMKRYIDNLFPHKTATNSDKGLNLNNSPSQGEVRKRNLFEPSYRRKMTNKMYDFKKFKIFVDYNERKENPQNLLAFAKNNQIIMSSIQTKFAENKKERSIENLDEDINVDDLLEDNINSKTDREHNGIASE